jgi:para-nitrobenzyl esterase
MDSTTLNRACLLALGTSLAACGSDAKPDPTHVQISDGEIQGSIEGTSLQFLGIPYAKPPVGDLRWKAPVKPDKWTAPRMALQFGKRCAQLGNPTLQNEASTDEDCLYLNVWTPSPAPKKAPVMVWLHGGGNVNGSASEPVPFLNVGVFYSGQPLAENQGVVVVTLNYRLGIFGFFAHPGVALEEGHAGNQGLQDQQLAMQWVQDNIAKFGGDPDNVTIFGESAGSYDVCMHVASPSGDGLFHRAISESGGCTTLQPTKAQAEVEAVQFAVDAGCTTGEALASLACLRGKSAADVMALPDVAKGVGFGPNVDGWFMPDQPRAIYDAGNMNHVPYLLGSNTDEGTLFLPATKPTTEDEYKATLTQMFGADVAPQVAALYSMAKFSTAMNPATAALARVIGDSRLVCSTVDTAQRMAAGGGAVFMYNYDIPVPAVINPNLGATHGSELTSVFGTSPTFDAGTKAASDLIQRYWTRFAGTGDPNGGTDLKWPATFGAGGDVRVNLAVQSSVVTDFRKSECQFWQAGYAKQFPSP